MAPPLADIGETSHHLNELISKLDQAVKDNTGLGAYDEQRKQAVANAPNITPNSLRRSRPTRRRRCRRCANSPPENAPPVVPPAGSKNTDVVELSPGAALGNPGRIKPEIAFSEANGRRYRCRRRGARSCGFSEKTQLGGQSKGIVLKTRQGAQVTSPCDG